MGSGYEIGDFVADARSLMAKQPSTALLLDSVANLLKPLLKNYESVCKRYGLLAPDDYASRRLYEDADYGFVIMFSIDPSGLKRPPHDHGEEWAVYGMCNGGATFRRYTRDDNGSREGYAELREIACFDGRPGDVDLVAPGGIHAIENPAGGDINIIVRSKNQDKYGRYIYNLEDHSCAYKFGIGGAGHRQIDMTAMFA